MNLNDFIKENRESFIKEELPKEFNAQMVTRIKSELAHKKANRKLGWLYPAIGVAAALLLLLTVVLPINKRAKQSEHIAEMELYYILIKEINQLNSAERDFMIKDGINESLKNITEEQMTPIEQQLPPEMSESEKQAVLKHYYSEKNKGLERLRNYLAER